jgi:hypothetical protein
VSPAFTELPLYYWKDTRAGSVRLVPSQSDSNLVLVCSQDGRVIACVLAECVSGLFAPVPKPESPQMGDA